MWAFAMTWHPSSIIIRPSVVRRKLSHLNLLLWNPWTKLNISSNYTPTLWVGAILQSPCLSIRQSVRLSVRSHFLNRYLSFYWKKWFYIWYMALAWWLVLCLPFSGLPHIYFLFTVRLTNERVGVFLAWRSVQHLVSFVACYIYYPKYIRKEINR